MHSFAGMRVQVSPHIAKHAPDFSGYRSPSRARRRYRQRKLRNAPMKEIPQMYRMGDVLIVSPLAWQQLRARIEGESHE